MRHLLTLALIACNSSQASKIDSKPPPQRNFVCERVPKEATCEPEFALPEMHTARVTTKDGTVACGLAAGQLSVVCNSLFVRPEQPKAAEPAADVKPAAKAPKAK